MADDPDLGDRVCAALRGGGDPVARSVARARLARELFARDHHPVRLGRYQLLCWGASPASFHAPNKLMS